MTAPHLTPREAVVLFHLVSGMSQRAIATRLGIAANTLKVYKRTLFRKLGVGSELQAAIICMYGVEAGYTVEINQIGGLVAESGWRREADRPPAVSETCQEMPELKT